MIMSPTSYNENFEGPSPKHPALPWLTNYVGNKGQMTTPAQVVECLRPILQTLRSAPVER